MEFMNEREFALYLFGAGAGLLAMNMVAYSQIELVEKSAGFVMVGVCFVLAIYLGLIKKKKEVQK